MATTPRTVARVFSGRDGQRLVFDQSVGEGFSGGPVIGNDKVVGLVTDTDNRFTYGISFIVLREFLVGSGVKLAEATVPAKPAGESRVGGTPPGGEPPPVTTGTTAIKLQFVADTLFNQYGCALQIGVNIGGTSANPGSNPYTIPNVPLGRQNYQITGQVVCSLFWWPRLRGAGTWDDHSRHGRHLRPPVELD